MIITQLLFFGGTLLLLAVPTTMQSVYAQFGEEEPQQSVEEQAEGKSAYELQLEAIQAYKELDLTPENRKFVEFLERQLISQQQLNREIEQLDQELGLGGPSTTTTPTPRDTGEEAARRGAAVMDIYRSYLNATEHVDQARTAVQNNDAQAVLGNLTLIENELESMNNSLDNVTAPVRSP